MEFLTLEQGNLSVGKFAERFTELAQHGIHLIPDEARKARRFVKGLKTEL